MTQRGQLVAPEGALRDPKSFEVLRVWIANNNQHVSLRADVWEDPAAWGLMLADLAQHIANTYEPVTALDREQILNRIKAGFDSELDNPTDTPSGS
jgi:hypothetical protein